VVVVAMNYRLGALGFLSTGQNLKIIYDEKILLYDKVYFYMV
jgi:carboxylesterase type B